MVDLNHLSIGTWCLPSCSLPLGCSFPRRVSRGTYPTSVKSCRREPLASTSFPRSFRGSSNRPPPSPFPSGFLCTQIFLPRVSLSLSVASNTLQPGSSVPFYQVPFLGPSHKAKTVKEEKLTTPRLQPYWSVWSSGVCLLSPHTGAATRLDCCPSLGPQRSFVSHPINNFPSGLRSDT